MFLKKAILILPYQSNILQLQVPQIHFYRHPSLDWNFGRSLASVVLPDIGNSSQFIFQNSRLVLPSIRHHWLSDHIQQIWCKSGCWHNFLWRIRFQFQMEHWDQQAKCPHNQKQGLKHICISDISFELLSETQKTINLVLEGRTRQHLVLSDLDKCSRRCALWHCRNRCHQVDSFGTCHRNL